MDKTMGSSVWMLNTPVCAWERDIWQYMYMQTANWSIFNSSTVTRLFPRPPDLSIYTELIYIVTRGITESYRVENLTFKETSPLLFPRKVTLVFHLRINTMSKEYKNNLVIIDKLRTIARFKNAFFPFKKKNQVPVLDVFCYPESLC